MCLQRERFDGQAYGHFWTALAHLVRSSPESGGARGEVLRDAFFMRQRCSAHLRAQEQPPTQKVHLRACATSKPWQTTDLICAAESKRDFTFRVNSAIATE